MAITYAQSPAIYAQPCRRGPIARLLEQEHCGGCRRHHLGCGADRMVEAAIAAGETHPIAKAATPRG